MASIRSRLQNSRLNNLIARPSTLSIFAEFLDQHRSAGFRAGGRSRCAVASKNGPCIDDSMNVASCSQFASARPYPKRERTRF
jgi:hypothetical protein